MEFGPLLILNFYSAERSSDLHRKLAEFFHARRERVSVLGDALEHPILGAGVLEELSHDKPTLVRVYFPWKHDRPPSSLSSGERHPAEIAFVESCEAVEPDLASLTIEIEMESPSELRGVSQVAGYAFKNVYISSRCASQRQLEAEIESIPGLEVIPLTTGWYLRCRGLGDSQQTCSETVAKAVAKLVQ